MHEQPPCLRRETNVCSGDRRGAGYGGREVCPGRVGGVEDMHVAEHACVRRAGSLRTTAPMTHS